MVTAVINVYMLMAIQAFILFHIAFYANFQVALSHSLSLRRDLTKVLPSLSDSDPDFANAWIKVLRNPLEKSVSDEGKYGTRDSHPGDDESNLDGRPCLGAAFLDEVIGVPEVPVELGASSQNIKEESC